MNQNYVCTSTSTHVFMWWTECTHIHTRWVAIKVHPTTDTCNSDLVLNEVLLELEKN